MVEVKESRNQIREAMKQANLYAGVLLNLLKARDIKPKAITPVGSWLDKPKSHLPTACSKIEVGPQRDFQD